MQLTRKQAKKLGLAEGEPAPQKGLRVAPSERTGLWTFIKAGWSVRSPDSIRYRLYVINQPALDTGLLDSEKEACDRAKELRP